MASCTSSSLDNDISCLGEVESQQEGEIVDLPPPCSTIEIPGPDIGPNNEEDEKERYVSERHEMIVSILGDNIITSTTNTEDVPPQETIHNAENSNHDEEAPDQTETSFSQDDASPTPGEGLATRMTHFFEERLCVVENEGMVPDKNQETTLSCTAAKVGAPVVLDASALIPGAYAQGPETGPSANPLIQHQREEEEEEEEENAVGLLLATANPVQELPQARSMDAAAAAVKQRRRKECTQTMAFVLGGVLVLMVIVIVAAVSNINENTTNGETTETTPSPSSALSGEEVFSPAQEMQLLLESLPQGTQESVLLGSDDDIDTPQSQAWNWLLDHPNVTALPPWRKKQLFSLTTFYFAFEGPQWPEPIRRNWLNVSMNECDWINTDQELLFGWSVKFLRTTDYDVRPCNDAGEIQTLALIYLQLSNDKPTIPPEIALLTSLSLVVLAFSDINAPLSDMMSSLVQLSKLEGLVLPNNQLTGNFPTDLALLTVMKNLVLTGNDLTGTIPPMQVAQLGQIKDIMLGNNRFSGSIPTQFGLMTSMTHLDLFANSLTGPIPTEMGLMTNLENVAMYSNSFTGTVPSELGSLVKLDMFYLWDCHFSGWMPSELGRMSNMALFRGHENSFSGAIPTELYGWTNLEHLSLSQNQLTGSVPTKMGFWSQLHVLELQDNFLTGVIPSEVGLLTGTKALQLGNNQLSGLIPSELWQLSELNDFGLSNLPLLSGTVPAELCYLQNNASCFYASQDSDVVDSRPCSLLFDCTELFCGCDCPCVDE